MATRFVKLSGLAVSLTLATGGLVTQAYATSGTADANAQPGVRTSVNCGQGIQSIHVTPPSGFDPLTATDAELDANLLPPRPPSSKASEFATWYKFVTVEMKKHPTCDLSTGHPGTPQHTSKRKAGSQSSEYDSANWAGNIVDKHTYEDAKSIFKVPAGSGPQGNGAVYSSSWVGIGLGGYASAPLMQAGSESDEIGGTRNFYIWWEVYPQLSQQVVSHDVESGDTIYVHVHAATDSATMTVDDETRGTGGTYKYTKGSFKPDGYAEWILERTEESGYYPRLADSTTTFTDAEAAAPGLSYTPMGSLPHYYHNMVNCGSAATILATPGSIYDGGKDNIVHWKSYGSETKVSSCSVD